VPVVHLHCNRRVRRALGQPRRGQPVGRGRTRMKSLPRPWYFQNLTEPDAVAEAPRRTARQCLLPERAGGGPGRAWCSIAAGGLGLGQRGEIIRPLAVDGKVLPAGGAGCCYMGPPARLPAYLPCLRRTCTAAGLIVVPLLLLRQYTAGSQRCGGGGGGSATRAPSLVGCQASRVQPQHAQLRAPGNSCNACLGPSMSGPQPGWPRCASSCSRRLRSGAARQQRRDSSRPAPGGGKLRSINSAPAAASVLGGHRRSCCCSCPANAAHAGPLASPITDPPACPGADARRRRRVQPPRLPLVAARPLDVSQGGSGQRRAGSARRQARPSGAWQASCLLPGSAGGSAARRPGGDCSRGRRPMRSSSLGAEGRLLDNRGGGGACSRARSRARRWQAASPPPSGLSQGRVPTVRAALHGEGHRPLTHEQRAVGALLSSHPTLAAAGDIQPPPCHMQASTPSTQDQAGAVSWCLQGRATVAARLGWTWLLMSDNWPLPPATPPLPGNQPPVCWVALPAPVEVPQPVQVHRLLPLRGASRAGWAAVFGRGGSRARCQLVPTGLLLLLLPVLVRSSWPLGYYQQTQYICKLSRC
jgi:hypothetical protein